jgi:dTDP-4-dehydrorhamnose reductase
MKIWILGAGGMLGKSLQKFLIDKGISFVGSSKEEADVTCFLELEALCSKIKPTHIFNCAAFTAVDRAESEFDLAMKINGQAPGILGKLAKKQGARLIHVSTDYVFSGSEHIPFKEEDETNPINAYGRSKLEGEKSLLREMATACIVRTSWVYGAGGKNFISSIVGMLETKETLQVASDQVGRPTYVIDLAEALWELRDASGIYHFASSGQSSRFEIAKSVLAYMKEKNFKVACKEIVPVSASLFSTPAPRPSYSVLDTSKYEGEYKTPRHWKETLKELFL